MGCFCIFDLRYPLLLDNNVENIFLHGNKASSITDANHDMNRRHSVWESGG
jgi:hypothetical protein